MPEKDCVAESQINKFCVVRAENCTPCGNKYIDNAKKKKNASVWYDQSTYAQRMRVKDEAGNVVKDAAGKTVYRVVALHPNAHHLLCVAAVRDNILANPKLEAVLRGTQWCVNNATNMYPMPLFGHTVQHYCGAIPKIGPVPLFGPPPTFANIPQHDIGHTGKLDYIFEVREELRYLAKQVELANEKHETEVKDIASDLDTLSKKYEGILEKRGMRRDGTHVAWSKAAASNDPKFPWYEPFSMAATAVIDARGFPPFHEKTGDKIQKIARAIWGDE